MNVPSEISWIISKLRASENNWKARYMAAWGYSLQVLGPKFKDTPQWTQKMDFGLPASTKGSQEYTPQELYTTLTTMDDEFTVGHLQELFSLLEELVKECCPTICKKKINANNFKELKKFLTAGTPFDKQNTGKNRICLIDSSSEEPELQLAKETRNVFIHNGGKIDPQWKTAYDSARGVSTYTLGDDLPANITHIQQIEKWHKLIINIVDNLEREIQSI